MLFTPPLVIPEYHMPTTDACISTSDLLKFKSDIPLRRRWFTEASFSHPAKLHLGLLDWCIQRYTKPGQTILDPMAGIGSVLLGAIHQRNIIAREIEPKWLNIMKANAANIRQTAGLFLGEMDIGQADAREPWGITADVILCSPPYGCDATRGNARKGILSPKTRQLVAEGKLTGDWIRLAQATDSGQAASYLFWYGEEEGQIGHIRGARYWQEMARVYRNAYTALRSGGYMVLVIKDHIADGKRVMVCEQTVNLCREIGFTFLERHARLVYPLSLWQRLRKERGEPVVEDEAVLVFSKRSDTHTMEPTEYQGHYFDPKQYPDPIARIREACTLYSQRTGYRPTHALVPAAEGYPAEVEGVLVRARSYLQAGNVQVGGRATE